MQLTKTIRRTYNLGNYENIQPEYSITKDYTDQKKVDIRKEFEIMTEYIEGLLETDRKRYQGK